MKAPAGKNANLILVRAGGDSLHGHWLAETPDGQSFDLIILAYAPTFHPGDRADCGYIEIPGTKVAGYSAFLKSHRDLIERYERIALIDDDVLTDSAALDRIFAAGAEHGLGLWQPTLTWDSYFSHPALLRQHPSPPVRHVNFVEMMCPFFTQEALLQIEPLFHIDAETAIDILWSCILSQQGPLAVLDRTPVKHTRPVASLKEMNGFVDHSYGAVIEQMLCQYNVWFPGAMSLPHRTSARWVGRIAATLRCLSIAPAILRTPYPMPFPYRFAALLKRQLLRNSQICGNPETVLATALAQSAAIPSPADNSPPLRRVNQHGSHIRDQFCPTEPGTK